MDITDQRVIFSDNGTLTDYTLELSNYRTSTVTLSPVAGEDFIFIGSSFPFNHKFFEVETANPTAASLTIEIWNNKVWTPTTDLMDSTSVGGKSMAVSGTARFQTVWDKSWVPEQYSYDVTGLESSKVIKEIYSSYWTRISFSDDCSFTLKYIGHRFSDDYELYSYYPDLNNSALKASFASGKTTWDDQHFIAADAIIRDLKKSYGLLTGDQVLDHSVWLEASCHKAAEIIYGAFGDAYAKHMAVARERYKEALDVGFPKLDMNLDGSLSNAERRMRLGYMIR